MPGTSQTKGGGTISSVESNVNIGYKDQANSTVTGIFTQDYTLSSRTDIYSSGHKRVFWKICKEIPASYLSTFSHRSPNIGTCSHGMNTQEEIVKLHYCSCTNY